MVDKVWMECCVIHHSSFIIHHSSPFIIHHSSFIIQWKVLVLLFLLAYSSAGPPEGVQFVFKNRPISLSAGVKGAEAGAYFPRSRPDNAKLDTLSNWYNPAAHYVEFIRQDDALNPTVGIAIGFEFDEENEGYPFTPAHAVLQFKDFTWGGVAFSALDTMNYTGVSNDVSEDIMVEIDGFEQDTIWGRFSGLLVNGAGAMESIEAGRFRIRVYRVE